MADLSPTKELFLVALEEYGDLADACEAIEISLSYGYKLQAELSDEIVGRARSHLAVASLQAAKVVTDSMSVDGSKEKAELHLKAAEGVLDRTGVTKHTNVDVQLESDNGIFIIPGKSAVEPDTKEEE
jgi:hypothetical protein